MLRGLGNRVTPDQNILATKFVLRIAAFGRIAVRLNSVVKFKCGGIVAERGVDLFIGPNIECAFAVLGISVLEKAVRILGGKVSVVICGYVASDVIQNITWEVGVYLNLTDLQ